MATVIVASGKPLELAALRELICAAGHSVTGEATSGAHALRLVRDMPPDLLVLATDLAKMSGLEVVRRIKAHSELTKTLLYGEETASHFIQRCYNAGADGFVGKHEAPEELQRAVSGVLTGHRYFPRVENINTRRRAIANEENPLAALSSRELTILTYLARGFPNNAIAHELSLSEKTVSAHRSRLRQKLNANSLVELLDIANQHGILSKSRDADSDAAAETADAAVLRAMLDGTPLPLHVRDLQGRLIQCNEAFLQLHATTFDAVAHTSFDVLDGFAPDTARDLQARYLDRLASGRPFAVERCELARRGHRVVLHVWGTPWRDENGVLLGMICGTLDVTGREDMLKALALERDGTAEFLAGTNRFIAALSGEFKPTSALLLSLQTYAPATLAEQACETAARLERLAGAIDNLLRIEQGRSTTSTDRAVPATLVSAVVETQRAEIEARRCTLTLRAEGDIETPLRIDTTNFEHVVRLLLGRQSVHWPDSLLDITLAIHETNLSLRRVTLTIDTTPRKESSRDATSRPITVLAEAGGDLALILCRRHVEWLRGSLEFGRTPNQVIVEFLTPVA